MPANSFRNMILTQTQLCTFALCSCALCLAPSTTVERALQIHLFLTNKANFQKSQMNVSNLSIREYEQIDTWSRGKNKANSNPKQTQYKAKQTQFQSPAYPQEIAFSTACELVKITRPGDASGPNYMTTSWNNWKAENL